MTKEQIAQVREHLDSHLTDGHWHDGCSYCERRRRIGGNGFLPSDAISFFGELEQDRQQAERDLEQQRIMLTNQRNQARAELRALLDATRMVGGNIVVNEGAFTRAMNLIVEWFDA